MATPTTPKVKEGAWETCPRCGGAVGDDEWEHCAEHGVVSSCSSCGRVCDEWSEEGTWH